MPKVFVGSSTKVLRDNLLGTICNSAFGKSREMVLWTDPSIFPRQTFVFQRLLESLRDFHFAVFVFAADDRVVPSDEHEEIRVVTRDNVILEYGMFVGRLGSDRVLILQQDGAALPSDLSGLTVERYKDSLDLQQKLDSPRFLQSLPAAWQTQAPLQDVNAGFDSLASTIEAVNANLTKRADEITQAIVDARAAQAHEARILHTSAALGLTEIMKDRASADLEIKRAMANAQRQVKILGVSLRRFFHPGELGEHKVVADQSWRSLIERSDATWKVLVLDPESREALHRSIREEEKVYRSSHPELFKHEILDHALLGDDGVRATYRNRDLPTEVATTIRWLNVLRRPGKFEARYCRVAPMCFLAIVDDEHLFLEQYNYGVVGGRSGEAVPILRFKGESRMFKQLESHFDYIWEQLFRDPT